jgi:hypothetical protein
MCKMSIGDDRKFIHDMRNSMMVIRNLSQMLHDGMIVGKDAEDAQKLIQEECEKVIELLKDK